MTTHLFHAIPLTPIHIGDGSRLRPEDYVVDGDELLRFSADRVIADMPPDKRQAFVDAVGRGEAGLKEAQAIIRKAVDRTKHVFERVPVGRGSMQLKDAVENPLRGGEAMPFVRMGGRPFIPGSTLKGALRTGLLNACADVRRSLIHEEIGPKLRWLRDEVARNNRREPKRGHHSNVLQALALDFDQQKTEADPLRDVSVADAIVGEVATRIDKVTVGWTPRTADAAGRGRQMHVERLLSVIDRLRPSDVAFTVVLSITNGERQESRRKLDRTKTPGWFLHPHQLLKAVNDFHENRWREDIGRFYPRISPMYRRLGEARQKAEAYAAKLGSPVQAKEQAPLLLRIGRFTSFEAKSVDEWRLGWSPPIRERAGRLIEQAGTRSVLIDGADALPFGWLLLCPAAEAVRSGAGATPTEADRASPGAPPPKTCAEESHNRSQPSRRIFVGDEEVEIMKREGGGFVVKFLASGDVEWVEAEDIRHE